MCALCTKLVFKLSSCIHVELSVPVWHHMSFRFNERLSAQGIAEQTSYLHAVRCNLTQRKATMDHFSIVHFPIRC